MPQTSRTGRDGHALVASSVLSVVMISHATALALAALTVAAPSAHAQSRMSSGMQDVTRVTCTFPVLASGRWADANGPRAEIERTPLTLTYDAIDADDGTARFHTRYGPVSVIAKASVWSLHLLHTAAEGTVLLTTVFNREHPPGTFKAVHSVHEFTPVGLPTFASRPEQHYGDCTVERSAR